MKMRPFSGEVVALAGHTAAVLCAAASPDGRIITGSDDGMVKMWHDGACVRTIQAHTGHVNAVAVLPCGARFVTGSYDHTAKLWTLDGAVELTLEVDCNVMSAAALPDGVHFVLGLGGPRNEVRLYHVGDALAHLAAHVTPLYRVLVDEADWFDQLFPAPYAAVRPSAIMDLAVTPDGQHIISGSMDKSVKVWKVATKSLVRTCEGHTDWVTAVAAMPDGQRILSSGDDDTVRVWLLDGTLQNTFRLHESHVRALVALPDNQHALSGSWDNTVKLFNVNDGAVLRTFTHHTGPVHCLALLPDGLRFVSGSNDHTACIVETGLAP